MKKKIADIIISNLRFPYCQNCKFDDEYHENENCRDCHRANMGWELAPDDAEDIAAEILKFIRDSLDSLCEEN